MHLRGNVIYNTWENFWKKAYKSSYFRAQYDETSERTDWSLSERQLFTQSNGRTLLGQDTMGRLHFLCTPHDKIYAVPSGGTDLGGQFKGYIGQYYQNDTALLLGKMKYDLELDNGLMISGANKHGQLIMMIFFRLLLQSIRNWKPEYFLLRRFWRKKQFRRHQSIRFRDLQEHSTV